MTQSRQYPRYDRHQTYDWNYDHAPDPLQVDVPEIPGRWRFCGLRVPSPLGVAAGPLLNGRWVRYYASLGFDVLTYKTVRSSARECYPLPNLQPVRCGALHGGESDLPATDEMAGSWAVSFGMPSKSPEIWRRDIEDTRCDLPKGKVLSVSVVGTIQPGWTIRDLANDYARCAAWAVEAGADCIETNFSCPNVSTCDGQLYQDYDSARIVTETVREAIGARPLVIKIGHVRRAEEAERLLDAVGDLANALAMTNSVASTVVSPSGERLFGGQPRGVCGEATREASTAQVELFARLVARRGDQLELIGVGGAFTAADVQAYLAAGADSVHMATAAMLRPDVALTIRADLARALAATAEEVDRSENAPLAAAKISQPSRFH